MRITAISKQLPTIMLIISCICMMYSKIFTKPDQYIYDPEKGYLTKTEQLSHMRQIQAQQLSEEFVDTQLNLWYSIANDDIALSDINNMLGDDIYELENFRKNNNDCDSNLDTSISRTATGSYTVRYAKWLDLTWI